MSKHSSSAAGPPHAEENTPTPGETEFPLDYPIDTTAEVQLPQGWLQREGLLKRGLRAIGLDRAIAFTIMARGWSSIAGLGTMLLIARYLTQVEQGFYYTFYSLVQLQIVFELGFSVVILQTASHEAAHLEIHDDGTITGPEREHARLASVLQKSVRWYTLAALLMMCALLPWGVHFFRANTTHVLDQHIHWGPAWGLIVLATAFTFQIDPIFSFLEGCGFVPQVARTRLNQAVLGTVMGWAGLLLHHGLFAPGLIICCCRCCARKWARRAFTGAKRSGRFSGASRCRGCAATSRFRSSTRCCSGAILSRRGRWA
jgi:hypothetical protein